MRVFLIFSLFAITMYFASCTKNDNESINKAKAEIIGKWARTNALVFNNKTYKYEAIALVDATKDTISFSTTTFNSQLYNTGTYQICKSVPFFCVDIIKYDGTKECLNFDTSQKTITQYLLEDKNQTKFVYKKLN